MMRTAQIRAQARPGTYAGAEPLGAFCQVRAMTTALAEPLTPEDQTVQSMPDASPTKWHMAHTTWFFETFLLMPYLPDYKPFDERWNFLFNSYYEAVGPRHPRPQRGLLTRPSLQEVARYRRFVDEAMGELLTRNGQPPAAQTALTWLGINHEQQHQELILTDILHAFSCNPLRPAYRAARSDESSSADPLTWRTFPGGVHEIGHDGPGFAFDNEGPKHRVFLQPFRLADRLVTNKEWQRFIAEGGYRRAELWLSDGWAAVQAESWRAPLYWENIEDSEPAAMTLAGLQPLDPCAPVCHVSYYEADAYARWTGRRLPTEAEWEVAAGDLPITGNFLSSGMLRPQPAPAGLSGRMQQMFGDVWEWTSSAYSPYTGFRPSAGAVGEYNGKFMCNQMVLRGGSCVTPEGHVRPSYRNFFYPQQRWQFSGLRLAEDA